jgi:acyl-CoA synthetase (NDP forming)
VGLAQAAELDVPVVALTVGGSAQGRAMVTAHSGAIAGDDAAWEALFDTYGVHRTRDVEELVDTLELFSVVAGSLKKKAGIATVHDSGAERVLTADVAAAEGIPFADLGEHTAARLAGLLDDGLSVSNPLDVWGRGADTEALFTSCLTAVAQDPSVDVVALAVDLVEEYDEDESYPRAVLRAAAGTDKPVVLVSHVPAAVDQAQAATLRDAGIPVLEGVRSGLRALGHLRAHAHPPPRALSGSATTDSWTERGDSSTERGDSSTVRSDSSGWVEATEAMALLERFGLRTARTLAARNADGAAGAAAEVGFPVVVKTDEPGIEHRAQVGGVELGLAEEAAVRAAYARLVESCGPRVVVQPEVAAEHEVALGVVDDATVGPILMLAVGGSRIEELSRRVLVLPPLTEPVAEAVVARFARLVPDDVPLDGLAGALVALSRLVEGMGPRLAALDVNPLRLTPGGPVAVDALVQLASR